MTNIFFLIPIILFAISMGMQLKDLQWFSNLPHSIVTTIGWITLIIVILSEGIKYL